jgi:hypothetical protein
MENLYYSICVDCRRAHFGSAIALYAPAVPAPRPAIPPRPSMEGLAAPAIRAINRLARIHRRRWKVAPAPAVRARHASDAPADRKAPQRR